MAQITPVLSLEDDNLLSPQNAVIAFIDYQRDQYAGVHSIDHGRLKVAINTLAQVVYGFALPMVVTTVGKDLRGMDGTDPSILTALGNPPEIDRNTLNSWEDDEFRAAIEATGRKKLIIAGLWTEICVAFPALDALKAGYDVYVVADAIGGVSVAAHEAAMQRMISAGAKPISVIGLAAELQRDWGREGADRLRGALQSYFGGMARLGYEGVY